MQPKMQECRNCGASLAIQAGGQAFVCKYCGSSGNKDEATSNIPIVPDVVLEVINQAKKEAEDADRRSQLTLNFKTEKYIYLAMLLDTNASDYHELLTDLQKAEESELKSLSKSAHEEVVTLCWLFASIAAVVIPYGLATESQKRGTDKIGEWGALAFLGSLFFSLICLSIFVTRVVNASRRKRR